MSSIILDTSAVIALINNEAGADHVRKVLRIASVGTVNLGESYSKLEERGVDGVQALSIFCSTVGEIVPFSARQAEITGQLRPVTRHLGLSLGDRACLALGIMLAAEVYTADSAWTQLQLPCTIRLIR